MVLYDPFEISVESSERSLRSTPMASTHQRLLATTIDILIFGPVISLLLSGLYKSLKMKIFLDEFSPERTELWLLWISSYYFLWVLLTSIFIYFRSSTPGGQFFKMRLINEVGEVPSFTAILIRQLVFPFHFIFLGTTLFEIYFHTRQKAFHDKLSETFWKSDYPNVYSPPNDFEKRFTLSLLKGFFIFFLLLLSGALFTKYDSIRTLSYSHKESLKGMPDCAKAIGFAKSGALSELIFLNQAKVLSSQCLKNEIDFVLYQADSESQTRAWAYFGLSLLAEDKSLKENYERMVCEEKNEACELIQFRLSKDGQIPKTLKEVSIFKYFKMQHAKADRHYAEAYRIFEDLQLSVKKDLEGLRLSILIEWAHSKLVYNSKPQDRQPSSVIQSAPIKASEDENNLFWQEWDNLRGEVKL